MGTWTFLTNHAVVLQCVGRRPEGTLRTLAADAGLTERATHKIVNDLVEDGYLTRRRDGRRCRYEVHPERPLRHPLHQGTAVSKLLSAVAGPQGDDVVVDLRCDAQAGAELEELRSLVAAEKRALAALTDRRQRLQRTLDHASRLLQAADPGSESVAEPRSASTST